MIKTILTDFDGTIVDSWNIHKKVLIKNLNYHKISFHKDSLIEKIGTRLNIILKELNVKKSHLGHFKDTYFDELTKETSSKTIFINGSLNALKRISKKVPIIIISNSRTTYLKKALNVLGIKDIFKGFYGEEKFSDKEEMIKKLLKRYKIKPTEVIYMGDRYSDIRIAKNTGCISVALYGKNSWSNKKELKKENPDFLIKNFEDLEKIFLKN